MTVSSAISRMDYTAVALLDTYPFTFEIYTKNDLKVYVGGVLKTVDVNYSIPVIGINNPAGGNVVFIDIPTAGQAIAIILDLPLTQLINYVEGDKFPAETHEKALDRQVKIAQNMSESISRTLKFDTSSILKNISFPEAGAGGYIRWNALGTGLEAVTAAGVVLTQTPDPPWIDVRYYATLAAANTAAFTAGKTLLIPSNYTLTANTTLTAATLVIKGGGFTKASTYSLTISGPFEAGLYQVFTGFTYGVDLTFSNNTLYINPVWYGGTGGRTASISSGTGSGGFANLAFGTTAAPLTTDYPLVIDHHSTGVGGYGVYLKTSGNTLDGSSGFCVENLGMADGATFAVTTRSYLTGTTFAINASLQLTDSANGFVTAGFTVNDGIWVYGFTTPGNANLFRIISTVTAGVITFTSTAGLAAEVAGVTCYISNGNGGSALAAFVNSTYDLHDQYALTMLNTHGRAIIIQSQGTGEAIEIRRNANASGAVKSGAHIYINENYGDFGHLTALRIDGYSTNVGTEKMIEINKATTFALRIFQDGSIYTKGEISMANNKPIWMENSAGVLKNMLYLNAGDALIIGTGLATGCLFMNIDGTVRQVTLGAPDSGGAGFRYLKVPNA